MARKPKSPPPAEAPDEGTVTVRVGGQVSDGKGGYFPEGAVIPVTAEQAESLRRQGFAA